MAYVIGLLTAEEQAGLSARGYTVEDATDALIEGIARQDGNHVDPIDVENLRKVEKEHGFDMVCVYVDCNIDELLTGG